MIYVISKWFDKFPEKKSYFEENVPPELFPVVDFEQKTIKANRLHSALLKYGDTFDERIQIIRKYIGAVNSDSVPRIERQPINKQLVVKITPSMETSPYMHGWYSPETRKALEGAIQHYKPRVVFELGVWYGQSSVGIFQSAKHKIEYYGFDYFTPTATNPDYVTMSHADKMFIPHPRLESAVSNLAPFSKKHDIYFVFDDVMKSPDFGVTPDLVFIDAIKKEQELVKIIRQFQKLNPDVIIVCDDYIFPSVRQALKSFRKKEFGDYCCILGDVPELPEPVSDFSKYPALKLTSEQKEELPSKLKTYFGGGTFFQELEHTFHQQFPKKIISLNQSELPAFKIAYGKTPGVDDTVMKQMKSDGIYDVLTFQYASSAKNMSPKLENVLERIKSSALKEFLRIFITNSNTLRNMLIGKIIHKTAKQPTSRMIFIPSSWDPKHYGQSVDAHDILFYGKTVETKFTLFDVYDKVLNNKKVEALISSFKGPKYDEIALLNVGIYPPENNQASKNILIQILSFKECLAIGGKTTLNRGLTKEVLDHIVLLSSLFKKVDVHTYTHRLGFTNFRVDCRGFLGMPDGVYSTLKRAILKDETQTIAGLFKENDIFDFESLDKKYTALRQHIESRYMENRQLILKSIDKIKEQQIDRTIQDIYKYILLEENESELD
jgi:predicted O-methyltransferase YrrM